MSLSQMANIGIEIVNEFPLKNNILMLPSIVLTKCKAWNFMNVVLFQLMPSMMMDFMMSLKGEKKM